MKVQFQNPNLSVFESDLFQTTTTVISLEDAIVIVDPNWLPREIKYLQEYVDSIRADKEIYLFFTHSDYDHIIGYAAFKGAITIASSSFVNHPDAAKQLEAIRQFDDDYYLKRDYPIVYPEIKHCISIDGASLQLGNTTAYCYHAPGHTSDGLFLVIPSLGLWVAGDYLCEVEFPYVYHSFEAYKATLERAKWILDNWDINILVVGHGPLTMDVAAIRDRIVDAEQYINQLYALVQEGKAFSMEALWQRYDFPRLMLKYHEANIALLKKELGQL